MSNTKNKSVVFFGDSICEAASDRGYGWPGRVGEALHLRVSRNHGLSGASVSDVRGANRILRQIERDDDSYDAVLLHGGVNDAWDKAPVGEMTESAPEQTDLAALDQSTFAGALEYLLAAAKQRYPDAQIGYILNFRLVSTIGNLSSMDGYAAVTRKICAKWGIPVLDLYDDAELNAALHLQTKDHAPDGIHPNPAGYDLIAPKIIPFVAALLDESHQ